ncbi:MAG: tRNA (cytidine(34)-2'-O)-methyltransferase [Sterolibacterium sp.]|jgi:tRNA (cytidine/uridine-2'-O-)-methyltransferase|nr:tRNA (cytidine(34)-2'-O)-methyltransferase [Sterolibacterium sp.]MBP9799544.1 tRNA (cytidine(34)-2'-O)-methyltransferase [Sterolibacterium sp.]
MFHIILHEPEIPPNTGNVIRLCANTGARLHLIHPLGFDLSAARLRRAGMDYAEIADITLHDDLAHCLDAIAAPSLFALSTRGTIRHDQPRYQPGDAFLFGAESRGLPAQVLDSIPEHHRLRLPMRPDCRSVNLSNTVAVVAYEAWRQLDFVGAA